jgi:hypothetical protein
MAVAMGVMSLGTWGLFGGWGDRNDDTLGLAWSTLLFGLFLAGAFWPHHRDVTGR